jgi:hypothetical protein
MACVNPELLTLLIAERLARERLERLQAPIKRYNEE